MLHFAQISLKAFQLLTKHTFGIRGNNEGQKNTTMNQTNKINRKYIFEKIEMKINLLRILLHVLSM